MKHFYLDGTVLRMVNADGSKKWILIEDGTWLEYGGYDTWPTSQGFMAAKVVSQVKLSAAETTVGVPDSAEKFMARKAGRNL